MAQFLPGDCCYFKSNPSRIFCVTGLGHDSPSGRDGKMATVYPMVPMPRLKLTRPSKYQLCVVHGEEGNIALAPPQMIALLYNYGDVIECSDSVSYRLINYSKGDVYVVNQMLCSSMSPSLNGLLDVKPSAHVFGEGRYVRPEHAMVIYQPNQLNRHEYEQRLEHMAALLEAAANAKLNIQPDADPSK